MSEYQTALDDIIDVLTDCERTKYLSGETILKERNELNLLQELVAKEIPQLPIALLPYIKREERSIYYLCPHCKEFLPFDVEDDCVIKVSRCRECGGLLDWSDEGDYEVTYENNCCKILDRKLKG